MDKHEFYRLYEQGEASVTYRKADLQIRTVTNNLGIVSGYNIVLKSTQEPIGFGVYKDKGDKPWVLTHHGTGLYIVKTYKRSHAIGFAGLLYNLWNKWYTVTKIEQVPKAISKQASLYTNFLGLFW